VINSPGGSLPMPGPIFAISLTDPALMRRISLRSVV